MNKISLKIHLLFGLAMMISTLSWAKPFLRIVQPYENADLPFVEESFVFGSVLPATSSVFINGVRVEPHKNGGFLAMVPFSEGRFKIEALASDGVSIATATRYVNVAERNSDFEETYGKIKPITPTTRVVLRVDDLLHVSFKAAPGGVGSFRFKGRGKKSYPMKEEKPGTYKTSYRIQSSDRFDKEDLIFHLKRKDGKKISKRAGARITVQRRRTPRYVELVRQTVLLTGPGSSYGYQMFFLKGARLEVTGEMGSFYRVYLDQNNYGWIKKSVAKELPSGTPAATSVARNIRIDANEYSTILELPLEYVHPHQIEQFVDPHRLSLTLYGVIADTDRIRYKNSKSVIKEVGWKRFSPDSYTLEIETNQAFSWGYDVRYEDTTLILEIRHGPRWKPSRSLPFKGLKVALDAGHSKQNFGTIGPWGNTEASVVLMVAKVVRRDLEAKGAQVVMIQDGTKELSLRNRIQAAWKERADLFISIHADACGEGQNPYEKRGYSVHYYQPQSRLLAEEIHKAYGRQTDFVDQGVWRSNLAVCRTTHMPSILLEQGFLILPDSEEIMLTPEHHNAVSRSLLNAITAVLKKAAPSN